VSTFSPQEVDQAFQDLWRVGPVGEDWSAQADLFTEDCVYFDHFYGLMSREQFRRWCTDLMTNEFPELYTVYEWHAVDGDQVIVAMQNRRDSPDPTGPRFFDFPGVSVFRYAGNGRFSEERDYWDRVGARESARLYREACARQEPDHPRSRSRLHWPARPPWARPT
jgi:ketosteroid isomerase-like protein